MLLGDKLTSTVVVGLQWWVPPLLVLYKLLACAAERTVVLLILVLLDTCFLCGCGVHVATLVGVTQRIHKGPVLGELELLLLLQQQ